MKTYKDIKTYDDFLKFFRIQLVLCNEIINVDNELYYNLENGEIDEEEEIFQWYIINGNDAETLKMFTNELVFYSDKLDVYVWGITHFGTAWDYVNITIKKQTNE